MKRVLAGLIVLSALFLPFGGLEARTYSLNAAPADTGQVCLKAGCQQACPIEGCPTSGSILKSLPAGFPSTILSRLDFSNTRWCFRGICIRPQNPPAPVPVPEPVPESQPQPNTPPEPAPEFNPGEMQAEMLRYINAERAKAGAAPLTLDRALCDGAYLKSKDMAENNYFSHTSPTYGSPFDMMKQLGISYRLAGENIAKHMSVKGAHDAFMNSSGHRANILRGEFKQVGLGFVKEGDYLYITQWFTD